MRPGSSFLVMSEMMSNSFTSFGYALYREEDRVEDEVLNNEKILAFQIFIQRSNLYNPISKVGYSFFKKEGTIRFKNYNEKKDSQLNTLMSEVKIIQRNIKILMIGENFVK